MFDTVHVSFSKNEYEIPAKSYMDSWDGESIKDFNESLRLKGEMFSGWSMPKFKTLTYKSECLEFYVKPSGTLFVHFSFSKIFGYTISNFLPIPDAATLRDIAFLNLEQVFLLHGVFIKVPISKGRLCRLDLFRNLQLPRPLSEYRDAFGIFGTSVTRKYLSSGNSGDSLYFTVEGNHEVIVYDKYTEQIGKGIPIDPSHRNTIRIEYKLRNASAIAKTLRVHSLQDLVDEWEKINAIFQNRMDEWFFKFDTIRLSNVKPLVSPLLQMTPVTRPQYVCEMLSYLTSAGINNNQHMALLAAIGAATVNANGSSIDFLAAVKDVLGQMGKAHPNRATNLVKEILDSVSFSMNLTSVPLIERYEELRKAWIGQP